MPIIGNKMYARFFDFADDELSFDLLVVAYASPDVLTTGNRRMLGDSSLGKKISTYEFDRTRQWATGELIAMD